MDKTFTFTLDDALPVNPQNKFELWRGDNVVFNFAFKSGGEDMTIPEGTKLRIFAKKVGANSLVNKTDTPLFAADFDTQTMATFNSSQTSGDAGNYLLAVMLMTADTSIITAQGIYFDLLENGYAGVYQPSPDFRDDVLDALNKALEAAAAASESATQSAESAGESATSAQSAEAAKTATQTAQTNAETAAGTAVEKATAAAQSATAAANSAAQSATSAQSADAAKTAAETAAQIAQSTDAGQLMLSKLGAGQLWFNRGVLSVASFANLSVSIPISLCIEYDVDSWAGLGSKTGDGIMFLATRDVVYTTPTQYKGFYLRYYESGQLYFECANVVATPQTARFSALSTNGNAGLPTGRHTLVVCVGGTIEGGKPSEFAMYLDGVALSISVVARTMTAADITSTRALVVAQADNYANAANVGGAKVPVRLSRVRIFNFQMDADGSPYSVADYAEGKLVPSVLYDPVAAQRALLALEDYTINRNMTTRLVKDISGNAYDATVVESGGSGGTAWTGTVKGSRDSAVEAFVDEIKTQINQSNG